MNDLRETFDTLATRGVHRSADDVFSAALEMADGTRAAAFRTDQRDDSDDARSLISLQRPLETSTPASRGPTFAVTLVAVLAIAATIVTVAVVHWRQPSLHVPPGASPATTATTPNLNANIAVPGVTSSTSSVVTPGSTTFGSLVAAVLAANGATTYQLEETATRTTDEGQAVQWAYFKETNRRLFVAFGGPDLIASVAGLRAKLSAGPTSTVGTVSQWPGTELSRTVAVTNSAFTVIVRSEALDNNATELLATDLAAVTTQIATSLLTAHETPPPSSPVSNAAVDTAPVKAARVLLDMPDGAAGCSPPSPIVATEFRGTSKDAQIFGLIFTSSPSISVGDDVKLVIRMTGSGPLTITAIDPADTTTPLPVTAHNGSTFQRPGDEWDTSEIFTMAGCWQLHLTRNDATGDIWFQIPS